MWKEGSPVAPFHSRQYGGKGNTFGAIRIAYFLATDDTVNDTKFFPTNHEQPPRAGVISVECSIAGDFYSNLPQAELLGEPRIEGRTTTQQTTARDGGGGGDRESIDIDIGDGDRDRDDSNGSGICSSRNSGMISIGDCCRQVDEFDTTDNGNDNDEEQQQRQDSPVQNLQISCNDSRGACFNVYILCSFLYLVLLKFLVLKFSHHSFSKFDNTYIIIKACKLLVTDTKGPDYHSHIASNKLLLMLVTSMIMDRK